MGASFLFVSPRLLFILFVYLFLADLGRLEVTFGNGFYQDFRPVRYCSFMFA